MGGQPKRIEAIGQLSVDRRAAVADLVENAARTDRVRALDEEAMLRLRAAERPGAAHLLAYRGEDLAGYAHLDPGLPDPAGDLTGDLVVHPDHRRHGVGRSLVTRLLDLADRRPFRMWAHGRHPGARRLAETFGFVEMRALWLMRRVLAGPGAVPLPEAGTPEGVVVRTFRPGEDEDAWLAVNAAAFADHPEQGRWTRADLDARMAEPWFDPAGFFLAERSGTLAGFHWTKVHPEVMRGETASGVGEIYVLGIDPSAHRLGLGRVLAVTGLRHLRGRGVPAVILYVESDNEPAIALYAKLGFVHTDTDVMYRNPLPD